jgi:hypothetical protein
MRCVFEAHGRPSSVAEAREKALAEARLGYVKESFYREADFRAKEAEAAMKKARVEVADLTKVLERKSQELEDVIAKDQAKLTAAQQDRDNARAAAATLREEHATLKVQQAKELPWRQRRRRPPFSASSRRRPASKPSCGRCRGNSLVSFISLLLEICRRTQSLSMASPLEGPVPERGESILRASPRAW